MKGLWDIHIFLRSQQVARSIATNMRCPFNVAVTVSQDGGPTDIELVDSLSRERGQTIIEGAIVTITALLICPLTHLYKVQCTIYSFNRIFSLLNIL